MITGTLFEHNRTQPACLPACLPVEVSFEEGVKKVLIRKLGKERILMLGYMLDTHHHLYHQTSPTGGTGNL